MIDRTRRFDLLHQFLDQCFFGQSPTEGDGRLREVFLSFLRDPRPRPVDRWGGEQVGARSQL
ncbi:hypothetical protein D3C74_336560 [compost metagenome]